MCPKENVVGGLNNGWAVAMTLLGYERGEAAATMPIRFQAELDLLLALAREVNDTPPPEAECPTIPNSNTQPASVEPSVVRAMIASLQEGGSVARGGASRGEESRGSEDPFETLTKDMRSLPSWRGTHARGEIIDGTAVRHKMRRRR